MNGSRKAFYLFLALILPGLVFLFLKYFGKNEFAVEPLFVKEAPVSMTGCDAITLPYSLPDSIRKPLFREQDSLSLILFGALKGNTMESQWKRVQQELRTDPVQFLHRADTTETTQTLRQCTFLLREPFEAVLVDRRGVIRGQYDLADREDTDRLITEVIIILKKY